MTLSVLLWSDRPAPEKREALSWRPALRSVQRERQYE